MTSEILQTIDVQRREDHWAVSFRAMASPCEVLIRDVTGDEAEQLAELAQAEAARIEQKYSRYRTDNIVHAVNSAKGDPIPLDDETARLLDYAGRCYELSDGLFDVTSGALRRVWSFEGRDFVPNDDLIRQTLELVGWDKVQLSGESIRLLPGMEIDLGGIGKEYAVDRVAQLLLEFLPRPMLVNFGGDIRAVSPGAAESLWDVGIEGFSPTDSPAGEIRLSHGAIATSGVTYRHCFVNGQRLGHILDPRTGWPVKDTPKSVTVLGEYCLEAGLLSTMAMLHGKDAESFISAQNVTFRCFR